MRKSLDIRIGADPEFCFKNRDGVLVNADEVLRDRHGDELGEQQLLDYAYKSERPAITLFFEAVKNYNDSDIKLEQIEIFAAWGKNGKLRPTLLPEFTNDNHMLEIQNCVLAHVAIRHSSYRCFRPLLFYGASEERTKKKVVYTFLHLHMNNFGAAIEEGVYGGDWSIGLSYNLRKDTKRCLWIIKRIIKVVNDEYRREICAE